MNDDQLLAALRDMRDKLEGEKTRNFFADILEAADGEDIEAVVIGEYSHGLDKEKNYNGQLMSWKEALHLLNYAYDDGFGSPDCHAVYVWTKSRVLFVKEYDGSIKISSVPRSPIEVMPVMH